MLAGLGALQPPLAGEDRPKPSYDLLCEWVGKAWDDISPDLIKKAFKKGKCWDFAPEYIEEVKAAPANPVYEASTLLLPKAKYDQLVDQNELDGVLELVVRDLNYENRHNAAAAEPSSGSDMSDTDETTTGSPHTKGYS